MRPIRLVPLAALLPVAVACAGVSDAAAPEATARPDTVGIASVSGTRYVLQATNTRSGAPVASFDITCDTVRTRLTVRDTITLWADGTARRVAITRLTRNERVEHEGKVVNTGTWRPYVTSPYAYYDQGPGVVLRLMDGPTSTTAFMWHLRRDADGRFSTRMAMGAVCAASATTVVADDPRTEEFFYRAQ